LVPSLASRVVLAAFPFLALCNDFSGILLKLVSQLFPLRTGINLSPYRSLFGEVTGLLNRDLLKDGELKGVLGLLMVPFLGVEFGLKGEAIIPFDKARIHPLGFESLLSNSGSILELICFSRPYIQEFSFTRVF